MPDQKINFCTLKLLCAKVANTDIGSPTSLHTLFDTDLDYMVIKFKQNNCMVRNRLTFDLFDKNGFLKPTFEKALTPFWKIFLLLKKIVDC